MWITAFVSLITLISNLMHLLVYPEQWVSIGAANDYGPVFQLAFYGTLVLPIGAIMLEVAADSMRRDPSPPEAAKVEKVD